MPGKMVWFGRGLDQDWVDSANGFWSVLLLSVCSVGAFLVRYVTQPITCWANNMDAFQTLHIQKTCFLTEDKLFYDVTSAIHNENPISYHLWIPIILSLQAVCFKIPNVIWILGKTINIENTVSSLKKAEMKSDDIRTTAIRDAAKVLYSLLRHHVRFLSGLYIVVKVMFLLNLVGQFIFLTIFFRHLLPLKPEYNPMSEFERVLPTKSFLPVDVMCRFSLVQNRNVQQFMFPCQLPIAEIYQKLFVFLWYWVFFLIVVTLLNLLQSIGFLFLAPMRNTRICAYIEATRGRNIDDYTVNSFIRGLLGIDGVLVLSMMSWNLSEMMAASLINQLYQIHWDQHNPVFKGPSEINVTGSTVASGETLPPPDDQVEHINMDPISDTSMNKPLVDKSD